MALTANGFDLTVTLVDNGGNNSTLTYNLIAADHATALTATAAVIAALNAVTNSVISGYNIRTKYSESAFAYPAAGIENEDKASISVLLDGLGNKKANIKIPAPVIGIFTSASGWGANVVDISDADLLTYLGLFEDGGECTISDGEYMDVPLTGKRVSAKSNTG